MTHVVVPIAVLVDSSAALAGQWPLVLRDYIYPIFSRLVENQSQLQIAFVTYALASTIPSPVVARRYFSLPTQASKELKEEPGRLGLGSTSTGGSVGMAVLEGYAAALEMFDLFNRNVATNNKENVADKASTEGQPQNQHSYHLIHVCAGSPDGAIHPCHNQLTDLDGLTWKTLPEELRKRNINLSIVMLKQIQPLIELHSLVVPEPCKPWYKVRQDHTILLSAQSAWASSHAKRKDDQPPENSEAKRPRISSPKLSQSSPIPAPQTKPPQPLETKPLQNVAGPSPKPHPQHRPQSQSQSQPLPLPQPQPQHQAQSQPQPQSQPTQTSNTTPSSSSLQPNIQLGQQSLRVFEEQLRKQLILINNLVQHGHTAQAELLKKQLQPKVEMFKKLKEKLFNPANANPGGSAQSKTEATPSSAAVTSAASPNLQSAGAPSDNQSQAQFVQARQQVQQTSPVSNPEGLVSNATPSTSVGPRPGPAAFPSQLPVNLAAQMQKLTSKEGIAGQNQMPSLKTPTQATGLTGGQQSGQAPAPHSLQQRQRWEGTITWNGRENNGSQPVKMEARVFAMGAPAAQQGNMGNIRPELWPAVLDLRPSNEQVVSTQELKAWINQHKPAICSFQRSAQDSEDNANRFRSFCRLLNEKHIYAIGSWPLPGTTTAQPTILIFSAGTAETVAGLVFPETGLPNIPKPASAPQIQTQIQPIPQAQPAPGPSNRPIMSNNIAGLANAPAFLQKLLSTPGLADQARHLLSLPPDQQRVALQKLHTLTMERHKQQALLLQRQQQQQQLQQQAQSGGPALAAIGNNPMGANFPGGAWGQANQPAANTGQGFNFGLNGNLGGAQMPNLGYGGINMSQGAQMQPGGMNMNAPNMNLMNMNNMNASAGMQLNTLGGMGARNATMQQQPGQAGSGPQIINDSVQAFLQRNGLSGGR